MAPPKTKAPRPRRDNAALLTQNGFGRDEFISSGEKTKAMAFRIFLRSCEHLNEMPYKNNGSVLARILFDMYFKDQIPAAKLKFRKIVLGDSTEK